MAEIEYLPDIKSSFYLQKNKQKNSKPPKACWFANLEALPLPSWWARLPDARHFTFFHTYPQGPFKINMDLGEKLSERGPEFALS